MSCNGLGTVSAVVTVLMTSLPSSLTARPITDRFLMLDLLRGLAAIAVLVYHDKVFLGVELLPSAYLAVDLFFLLSGFVIAHNYDAKIASGMSLTDFVVQRLIRLYPCFLLTFALGFLIASGRYIRDAGYMDVWRLLGAGAANLFFLPAMVQPYKLDNLFPFNGAAWSLTFELIANITYWLGFRFFNKHRLILLIVTAAIVLAIPLYRFGTIDVGMRTTDFFWGIPRVLLSFYIGVALRRHVYGRIDLGMNPPGVATAALLLLAAFSLSRWFNATLLPGAEMLMVAIVFPLLLLGVSGVTPGPRAAWLCKWTGDASYPVYLLQNPFIGLFAAVPQLFFGVKAQAWMPWIGIAHVVVTIQCALWIDRRFELPLRKTLKQRWSTFLTSRKTTGPSSSSKQIIKDL
jgi:peptidoglycan/LPS O-acetylase OafA/YrhL